MSKELGDVLVLFHFSVFFISKAPFKAYISFMFNNIHATSCPLLLMQCKSTGKRKINIMVLIDSLFQPDVFMSFETADCTLTLNV